MIRKPFLPAVGGHARPDLNRVADGIAASLREFSTAQQRAAAADGRNGGSGSSSGSRDGDNSSSDNSSSDNSISRPTGRQRAAAAFSDLMELNNRTPMQRPFAGRSDTPFKRIDLSSEPTAAPDRSGNAFRRPDPRSESAALGRSNTVFRSLDLRSESAAPGRSGTVFRSLDLRSESATSAAQAPGRSGTVFRSLDLRSDSVMVPRAPGASGANIIRGGFGGGFGMGRGGGFRGRGRGGRGRGGRGRGGRGRGGRRGGKDGEEGDGDRFKRGDQEITDSPEVLAMRQAIEVGSTQQFDPTISKGDFAGWGPAVPTTGSSAAKDETVLRQARILGGGQYFHPLHRYPTEELRERYRKEAGVFFPTEEVKAHSAEVLKLEAFPPVPQETKDAVLQAALLGVYDGPQYADRSDTLGTVRNYVKRDSSFNADAERRVLEKVRSLLPGGRTGPAGAARGAGARA
ncbi:hypothetical protein F5Y14DRAFT_128087 [Nemania sp. NC0429]|nr:hypothetical protein F5Y14DRAFT_128087 [Nemania sp. NC0429]